MGGGGITEPGAQRGRRYHGTDGDQPDHHDRSATRPGLVPAALYRAGGIWRPLGRRDRHRHQGYHLPRLFPVRPLEAEEGVGENTRNNYSMSILFITLEAKYKQYTYGLSINLD